MINQITAETVDNTVVCENIEQNITNTHPFQKEDFANRNPQQNSVIDNATREQKLWNEVCGTNLTTSEATEYGLLLVEFMKLLFETSREIMTTQRLKRKENI